MCAQDESHSQLAITPEAQTYLDAGASPEKAVYDAVPADGGGDMNALREQLGALWGVGFKKAMEKRWVKVAKAAGGASTVSRAVDDAEDTCLAQLQAAVRGEALGDKEAADLKKRKLVKLDTWKTYALGKGPAFALQRVKPATDLTLEMLQSGAWRTQPFKEYNFQARSLGCWHVKPLLTKPSGRFFAVPTFMPTDSLQASDAVSSSVVLSCTMLRLGRA